MHQCPQYHGDTPHVGGPVLRGSTNVLIEGLPAARQGDPLQCNAPVLPRITGGSSIVMINHQPAARVGDRTNHQSLLQVGSKKVFIGG